MKSVLFGFAATAALLSLNVLPGAWGTTASGQSGFEERHSNENVEQLEADLGLKGA
jgi:hypothetical protein